MTLTKRKHTRPTKTDRKRSGRHHRVGNHYLKTYWPYLPVVSIFTFGFVINAWMSNQHRSVLGYATDLSASTLLMDTNAQRGNNHRAPLLLNTELDGAAQAKANDMAARNYWSHVTPDGKTPWSFMVTSGYSYRTAGENLAHGFTTAQDIITGWVNSPEHRANILGSSYQDVGFGVANSTNYQNHGPQTIVVALYASPAATAVTAAAVTPLSATPSFNAGATPGTQHVSRVELIGSANTWGVAGIMLLGTLGCILFIFRHAKAWHRIVTRGERFILRYPAFDIIAAFLITTSALLAHTAGLIR